LEFEERSEVCVEKLAKALEVFWAIAAKERRFRREIEPTTEPVKVRGSEVSGTERESSRLWLLG
jgi:hypothetical protein